MSSSQIEEFDSDWDRVHSRIISHSAEVLQLLDMAVLPGPCKILDLACGTGKHLIEFAKQGHQCIGIDKQESKLDKARERSHSLGLNIEFVCADMRAITFTEKFDLVLCLYAMSHMVSDEDLLAIFRVVRKALDPDGVFIFNVLNREANQDKRSPVYDSVYMAGHLRDFTLDEVGHFLTGAGLRLQEFRMFDIADVKNLDLRICATSKGISDEE